MKYRNHADAVRDDTRSRAVEQHHLRAHLEHVLMAWRHLFVHDFPKAERKRLDAVIVSIQEFEQLGGRLCHGMSCWKRPTTVVPLIPTTRILNPSICLPWLAPALCQ